MKTKRLAAYVLVVLMGAICSVQAEVPDFKITPQSTRYRDYSFQVFLREKPLMHDQWRICGVTIVVSPGPRKVIGETGYLQIWHQGKFVSGSALSRTASDMLPREMQTLIQAKDPIIFAFSINPEFINGSWFNYQIRRDDGSVEMNCLIELTAFKEVPNNAPGTYFRKSNTTP